MIFFKKRKTLIEQQEKLIDRQSRIIEEQNNKIFDLEEKFKIANQQVELELKINQELENEIEEKDRFVKWLQLKSLYDLELLYEKHKIPKQVNVGALVMLAKSKDDLDSLYE